MRPEFLNIPLMFVWIMILAATLAFEIWMFLDAYKNQRLSTNNKIIWMLGMLLFHPFVAIFYYFTARKPRA